jgi:very-short-patch-repair endonuclease
MRTQTITLKRARRMRKALTPQELGLWLRLRDRKLGGFRFRRQHPMGPYILDFYCPEARLAIEIDGYSHGVEGAAERDARRDAWLLARNVETLRISTEMAKDPEAAAGFILQVVRRNAPSVTS